MAIRERLPRHHSLPAATQPLCGKWPKSSLGLANNYPEWEGHYIADLRDFRAELGPSQIKSRLTGGQLDAALADPRWAMEG
jgi:hypothetical protein